MVSTKSHEGDSWDLVSATTVAARIVAREPRRTEGRRPAPEGIKIWDNRGFVMRFLSISAAFLFFASPALADDQAPVNQGPSDHLDIGIKDHRFQPERLEIPANTKVKLIVHNLDKTAEEFESQDFNREKIVPAGGEIPVFVGPLSPGEYKFFGDFHQDTAQGVIVVR